jgi:hypothetical protein
MLELPVAPGNNNTTATPPDKVARKAVGLTGLKFFLFFILWFTDIRKKRGCQVPCQRLGQGVVHEWLFA